MLPASLLAAASLANSLEVYGKDAWPAIVQQYSAYTLADLAKARQQIKAVRLQPTPDSSIMTEVPAVCISLSTDFSRRCRSGHKFQQYPRRQLNCVW